MCARVYVSVCARGRVCMSACLRAYVRAGIKIHLCLCSVITGENRKKIHYINVFSLNVFNCTLLSRGFIIIKLINKLNAVVIIFVAVNDTAAPGPLPICPIPSSGICMLFSNCCLSQKLNAVDQ